MFRTTKKEKQLDMYSSVTQYFKNSVQKRFDDSNAWHNVFYSQVYSKIDEKIFSVLFTKDTGAPNVSITCLVSMMILKDGFAYGDSELYDNCSFNLLTRKALGLINMSDEVPAQSTYYLFRNRLEAYHEKTGIDLLDIAFQSTTRGQALTFNVNGTSVRMDSVLIGSNIANYSRYQIVHKSLQLFYKQFDDKLLSVLEEQDIIALKEIIEEDSSKTVYYANKTQIKERLTRIGKLIFKILNLFPDKNETTFQTLQQLFNDQFKVPDKPDLQEQSLIDIATVTEQVEARNSNEISAQSIQSPYDTDCTFRTKNEETVKGYSHNITETCDENASIRLITNIQTEVASYTDDKFFAQAMDKTQDILPCKIENVHTDGAYNSAENQAYSKEHDINFYPTAMQGAEGRFDFSLTETGLLVTDKQTGETQTATQIKSGKYRIEVDNKKRYFKPSEIETCQLRKQIAQIPSEIRNKRNNVEATMYQFNIKLRNNKTRYRGKFKNALWAKLRCMWINFSRIKGKLCQKTKNQPDKPSKTEQNTSFLHHFLSSLRLIFQINIINSITFNRIFRKHIIKNHLFLCDVLEPK